MFYITNLKAKDVYSKIKQTMSIEFENMHVCRGYFSGTDSPVRLGIVCKFKNDNVNIFHIRFNVIDGIFNPFIPVSAKTASSQVDLQV